MKALGLDYGEARIGVAGSDDVGVSANPLETIKVKKGESPDDAIARIVEIAEQRSVEIIIVGLPLNMDGSSGKSAKKVEAWADKISSELPDLAVEMLDERLSTVEAEKHIRASGRKVTKDIIDQAAAMVILQDYLDSEGGGEDDFENAISGGGKDLDLAAFADEDGDNFGFGDDDDEDDDEFGAGLESESSGVWGDDSY